MGDQDTVVVKLVQEIEKYSCLYDYTIKPYSNDRAKTAAWNEVAKTVNISGNYNYTVYLLVI